MYARLFWVDSAGQQYRSLEKYFIIRRGVNKLFILIRWPELRTQPEIASFKIGKRKFDYVGKNEEIDNAMCVLEEVYANISDDISNRG